jgi:uncharacterized protein
MIEEQTSPRLRELDRPSCLEHLASARFGRVVVAMPDGTPVIRPVNYVFDRAYQSVLIKSHQGSKLYALLRSQHATFEVDAVDHEARSGWSVIVTGVVEEVTHPVELKRVATLGADPWVDGPEMRWMRIRAFTVSGRHVEH